MTLDEAIEILTEHAYKKMKQFDEDLNEAEKLGIEALGRLTQLRNHEPQTLSTTWKLIFDKLPSEIEEGKNE